MRLIDADALKQEIRKGTRYFVRVWDPKGREKWEMEKDLSLKEIDEIINNAPTIDADEPRARGKWLTDLISYWTEPDEIKQFKCSVCKKGGMFTDNERVKVFRYCSYCGAKMEGVEE